jgi:SARP family transcriptional regulator, regulator of embCAB operon
VDVESATDAVHRAESAVAQDDFHRGHDAEWIDEVRRSLAAVHLRALETYAQAALGIGGTKLAAAVRAGRELTRLEP